MLRSHSSVIKGMVYQPGGTHGQPAKYSSRGVGAIELDFDSRVVRTFLAVGLYPMGVPTAPSFWHSTGPVGRHLKPSFDFQCAIGLYELVKLLDCPQLHRDACDTLNIFAAQSQTRRLDMLLLAAKYNDLILARYVFQWEKYSRMVDTEPLQFAQLEAARAELPPIWAACIVHCVDYDRNGACQFRPLCAFSDPIRIDGCFPWMVITYEQHAANERKRKREVSDRPSTGQRVRGC